MVSKNFYLIIVLILTGFSAVNLQAQKTRYDAWKAGNAPVIDGIANDECWNNTPWGILDKQWFSERPMPDSADFFCRYKIVWDAEAIYLLLEITDNVFNDNISNPLDQYWEEDCIEIFIDEDKSGGDHKCCAQAYNAMAYHISPITYDVVDLTDDGNFVPKLFNNHLTISVKSEGSLHLAEIKLIIVNDNFNEDLPIEPVLLEKGKLMGFSIAYCDDDGNGREDFLGTQAGGLDSWMNADLFGELLLIPNITSIGNYSGLTTIIFPNPASDRISIQTGVEGRKYFQIFNAVGTMVKSGYTENIQCTDSISLESFRSGIYLVNINANGIWQTHKLFIEN